MFSDTLYGKTKRVKLQNIYIYVKVANKTIVNLCYDSYNSGNNTSNLTCLPVVFYYYHFFPIIVPMILPPDEIL